jgi:uncharacterized tellurite resistance protein B-like protein
MPRDQAVKPRERNTALIEIMLLAAVADGKVSDREMETLIRRVLERPEFEGTKPEELNAMVEGSLKTLASAKDMRAVLASLRERLPDHKNRMLGFGLAAAIAFADQRASREELGLLKTFQAALGISEEEVVQLVDAVEKGGSLADALGEPFERLCAEVMVLVSAADGKMKEAETQVLVESLAADPVFSKVSPERAQAYVSDAVAALATEGLPERLNVLAHGLSTRAQRLKAFRLAMHVANASGEASASELKILDLLQATFGIADDEVERIRDGA